MKGLTSHRCAKQIVVALLINKGKCWYGTNWCANPQETCPRGDLPTGVGYEMCREICRQPGHAEVDALSKAGQEAKGASLYAFGHDHFCEACIGTMKRYGVIHWEIIGDENEKETRVEPETSKAAPAEGQDKV